MFVLYIKLDVACFIIILKKNVKTVNTTTIFGEENIFHLRKPVNDFWGGPERREGQLNNKGDSILSSAQFSKHTCFLYTITKCVCVSIK